MVKTVSTCTDSAEFRFYEELNDFLPRALYKKAFRIRVNQGETIKHAIEACGVPHPEVELVLVNGKSVDFSHPVHAGDCISVYPCFETFDVFPLIKVRTEPLRNTCFIADVHLGGLAKYLRALGFDTLYDPHYTDERIAGLSSSQRRIVLTRDRNLLMYSVITHGRYIRAKRVRMQVIEVVRSLDLYRSMKPFSRCMECNTLLVPVDREQIRDRLQENTQRYFTDFVRCSCCDQIYWQGSHYRRMKQFFQEVFGSEGMDPGT